MTFEYLERLLYETAAGVLTEENIVQANFELHLDPESHIFEWVHSSGRLSITATPYFDANESTLIEFSLDEKVLETIQAYIGDFKYDSRKTPRNNFQDYCVWVRSLLEEFMEIALIGS